MAEIDTYRRVKQAFDKQKEVRQTYEELWRECSELVMPEYMDLEGNWDPEKLIGDNVYDGSARLAAQIASAGMFGYSCNPADEWASIALSGKNPYDTSAVRDWITDMNTLLMATFEKYDIYRHLIPAFNSIVPIGTATITVEEDFKNNGIRYRFWHPGDYVIGTDAYNLVNQFGTEVEYENHQLLDMYTPEELGSDLADRIETNPWSKTTITYMIIPNTLYEKDNPFTNRMKFSGYHLSPLDQRIIKVDGFNEFPAAVWRWSVQGRLTYGIGMAAKALPDIYILNQSARTRIEAEQKMADPPVNIPAEMMDDYHLGPGGKNFYRSPDRHIFPVGTRYDYPAAIDAVNRYTDLVNRHMYTDFFMLLGQSTTRRTAQEVMEIQQEKAAMLGPIVSFMNKSFLDPLVRETLRILGKQGKLPQPPKEIMNEEYDIAFLGPLTIAQKFAQLQKRVLDPINTALQYAQVDQGVLDNFDFDTTTRLLGKAFALPYGILREEGDVAQIRQQRAEAQQAAMEAEAAKEERELMMKYGQQAPEEGSPMGAMQ